VKYFNNLNFPPFFSIGTMAITSLMIGNVVSEFKPMCDSLADNTNKMEAESVNMTYTDDPFNSTETAQNYNSDCIVGVAMSCSMLVGIIQVGLNSLLIVVHTNLFFNVNSVKREVSILHYSNHFSFKQ